MAYLGVSLVLALVYFAGAAGLAFRFTRSATWARSGARPSGAIQRSAVRLRSRDGIALNAWYQRATDARAAVILVHGCGASVDARGRSDPMTVVRALLSEGLSVLAIDLRGHGHSEAAPLTYGVRERLDVLGAVDWLRSRGYADGRIGVLGASMGGAAAIAAAAEEMAIGAVVSDSAFASFERVARRRFDALLPVGLGAALLPAALAIARMLTGADLRRFEPVGHARAMLGRPLMIVHAAGDELVPACEARKLAEAGRAGLWITPGGTHVGSFDADPSEYRRRIVGFLVRSLTAQAHPSGWPSPANHADRVAEAEKGIFHDRPVRSGRPAVDRGTPLDHPGLGRPIAKGQPRAHDLGKRGARCEAGCTDVMRVQSCAGLEHHDGSRRIGRA